MSNRKVVAYRLFDMDKALQFCSAKIHSLSQAELIQNVHAGIIHHLHRRALHKRCCLDALANAVSFPHQSKDQLIAEAFDMQIYSLRTGALMYSSLVAQAYHTVPHVVLQTLRTTHNDSTFAFCFLEHLSNDGTDFGASGVYLELPRLGACALLGKCGSA